MKVDEGPGLFELSKPPYEIPTLAEMLGRDNGLTAVSTFSGGGGSSVGLHQAGWRIPYASEFIPSARETYTTNFPETYVDPRDVRDLTAADILDRIGLDVGELDLFEGSPPCSSFSTANNSKASRYGNSKVKVYSDGVKQTTDDLFDEWLRILEGLMPRGILAENVPGLLQDDAVEFFKSILSRLEGLGYEVDAEIYNAMWYGSATSRRRVVFRGIRRDVGRLPRKPSRTMFGFSLGDALATLPNRPTAEELERADATRYAVGQEWFRLKVGETSSKYAQLVRCSLDAPLPSVTQAAQGGGGLANPFHPHECRYWTATELAWIFGYPADYVLTGDPGQRYERIARSVAPPLYAAHGAVIAGALGGKVIRDDL